MSDPKLHCEGDRHWWMILLTFIISGRKSSRRSVWRIWLILTAKFPPLIGKCWTWASLTIILSAQTIGTLGRPEMISAMVWKTSVDPPALRHPLPFMQPLAFRQLLVLRQRLAYMQPLALRQLLSLRQLLALIQPLALKLLYYIHYC